MQDFVHKTEKKLQSKNYSPLTIKSYLYCLKAYFKFVKKDFAKPKEKNINEFLNYLESQKQSPKTIQLMYNSIKFFYKEVLSIPFNFKIKLPSVSKPFPVILNKEEITNLLESIKNPKHKLILSLAYGSGLSVSEIVNLKTRDVDTSELSIRIIRNKDSDRMTVLPEKLKLQLDAIISLKNPGDYLFESERGGQIGSRNLQIIFENALKNSGIKKEASFHCLKHSFAVHLLESGVSLKNLQELLGHKNIRNTAIYEKLKNPKEKNIQSPL